MQNNFLHFFIFLFNSRKSLFSKLFGFCVCFYTLAILLVILVIINNTKYTKTIPAPVGIFKKKEINIPIIKQIIEIITEQITNPLKLFVNFLDITAGNIIKLEISNVPIILIPTTTTNAVISAIKN